MAINKYVHLGEVKFDITDSTVTADTLAEGVVAYGANGERIVGTGTSGGGTTGMPISVDELPSEGVEGAIYSVPEFSAVATYSGGIMYSDYFTECLMVATYHIAETLPETGNEGDVCYVTSENEIYYFNNGEWTIIDDTIGEGYPTIGAVANLDEMTEDGHYAIISPTLYCFTNGTYAKLLVRGNLIFTSNGDGTCYVSGIGKYTDITIKIPSVSPNGDSVTRIGEHALEECVLATAIEIPNSITSIDAAAFAGCRSLKAITIPNSVTSIGGSAFGSCYSIYTIDIPNSVISIGDWAFDDCFSLTSIWFQGTIAQWNSIPKGSSWNRNVPATYVQCTDGQVAL